MVLKSVISIALLGALSGTSMAQYFNSHKLFQQTRNEITIGVGPSNYLGELGGTDQVGQNFHQDLETSLSKFSLSIMYRRWVNHFSAFSGGFHFGAIEGNDRLTKEKFRNNRNIHFKSPILEASARYEFHFLNERPGALYHMKGVKARHQLGIGAYLFGGVAGYYFNPKARYQGRWVALQPLGTEGQGLNGTDPYSLFQISIPYGVGFRYRLGKLFRIGLEAGLRKTFTDYLDDTSTEYYDPEDIYAAKGEMALYLSNPTNETMLYDYYINPSAPAEEITNNPASKGNPRGDASDLDQYLFLHLTATMSLYHYSKFHRLRPKHARFRKYGKKYKPRAKF